MMHKVKSLVPILLVIVLAAWLRFVNLGYSDYQGDEIKSLYLPEQNQTFSSFLMDQRKGPIQFLVTMLVKVVNPTYSNEFITRLPFALAAFFAVVFFYLFVKRYFGKSTAIFAAFFMATNGFIVAFARISQYQSFVMLFMVLALYFVALAQQEDKWKIKGIYFGLLAWALSILAHYDGLFIAPFMFWMLLNWFKKYKFKYIVHFIAAGIIAGIGIAIFYIPFVVTLSQETLSYWQNRISGGQGKISSSKYLFSVYQPIYAFKIYAALIAISGISYFLALIAKLKAKTKLISIVNTPNYVLLLWFIIPFVFMEFAINIPGTHIYTYLVPSFIIIGIGITFLFSSFAKYKIQLVALICTVVVLSFLFLQSNAIFVDHSKEYPWENEKFLVWEFTKPSAVFHLSMFGFPYYRNWEGISNFFAVAQNNDLEHNLTYSTNERDSIVRFYLPTNRSSETEGFFVYIVNPQSFTDAILSKKPKYVAENYAPVIEFTKDGRVVAKMYYLPAKSLEELKLQNTTVN